MTAEVSPGGFFVGRCGPWVGSWHGWRLAFP